MQLKNLLLSLPVGGLLERCLVNNSLVQLPFLQQSLEILELVEVMLQDL